MNRNVPFNRKGGAQIGDKFYPIPTTQQFLANQAEKAADKMAARREKRLQKQS